MKLIKKIFVVALKKLDLASALAVRLTKITGRSKEPIHPKHFLISKPWFTKYIARTDAVLDLGCGNGQNSIKASFFAKKVIGVEINENLLKIAQSSAAGLKRKNVKFKTMDLEKKIGYKDKSFEKVIFIDVLEHLQNRGQILKEIRRILKPEGLLTLSVPNSQTSWKKLQRSIGICSFSDPDHKIEFSQNQIKKLIRRYFQIENFDYDNFDTPLRGLFDIIGVFSISLYRKISIWRQRKADENPVESSGFKIVAKKL